MVNHTHLKRARLPIPPLSHIFLLCFSQRYYYITFPFLRQLPKEDEFHQFLPAIFGLTQDVVFWRLPQNKKPERESPGFLSAVVPFRLFRVTPLYIR